MHPQKYLIVLAGPTASGKTNLSIALAKHYDCEILSCDSRQFYKEMNIGTAKPTMQQLQSVPHHFIGHQSIHDPYSVGDYEREALQCLNEIYKKNSYAILSGGSGLFIRALCEGLDQFPEVPETIRLQIEELYQREGLKGLQGALQQLDPEYFAKVDQQNHMRLIRALGVCMASGQAYSSFRKRVVKQRNFLPIYILLNADRLQLYQRINERVDKMMEAGLLAEVQNLFPYRHLQALQSVGYQELFQYLEQKTSLPEAVELIKRNSRRYAKRQMTWFRKDPHWHSFAADDQDKIVNFIDNY